MRTIAVFAALLAIAAAQKPLYIDVPVFPQHTAFEWEEIMANQHIPGDVEDLDAVPAGNESQPATSGMVIPPPQSHIVNGNVAYPGQFPWQAAISMDDRSFCGGSLISQKVVITAAHCVKGFSKFTVILGAHFVRRKEASQVVQKTTKAIAHQKYDEEDIVNDIAVLLFNEEFPITDRINTIALPTKSMASELFEGHTLTVSGFGRRDHTMSISPVLNYVRLPVLPNENCAKYFGKHVRSTNICGDGANGRSSCNGDSGGPFTVHKDGKEIVVGIVSFGSGRGCDVGYPSVYTRVTSYLAWIQEQTGIQISRE